MDVFLTTLGCRLNEAELERWHRDFVAQGHRVVRRPAQAQVMVLNTCAVTGMAARKSRQHIYRLHRENPSASLVITGCYAEMEPEEVAQMAGVDLVVGNQDKERLVALVQEQISPEVMPDMAADPEADASHLFATARTRAFVKVQDGCRNRCTFCIVTVLRGQERSRPVAEVIHEINALHQQGFQEVVLTGVHLGGYGSDLGDGADLRGLVQAVLAETSIPRVRLTSLEPWDLPEGFFSLWEDRRLGPHLHLPLQSGHDAVLKRMARRCSTSDFRRLVADARAAIPELTLTTDLIVGFPGESEEEWQGTLAFVEEIGFGHMHIFTYSPREGTTAARLRGHLSKGQKQERSQELHALAAKMKRAHLERFVGEERPVLWEGDFEVVEEGARRWSGYTDNYLRVQTLTAPDVNLENQLLMTRLERHDGEGFVGRVL
jgi:threonylcarbamoyladenosine tRNA methylthiotransferase MtaB